SAARPRPMAVTGRPEEPRTRVGGGMGVWTTLGHLDATPRVRIRSPSQAVTSNDGRSDNMADTTVGRHEDEGDAGALLGGVYPVKAAGDETNGALTVMEMLIPEGAGPPPHTHPGGEAVYILEGTVRYHIGGETIEGGPGSFFYVPEGTVETFE